MRLYTEDYVPTFRKVLPEILRGKSLSRVIRDAAMRELLEPAGDVLDVGGGHQPYYWSYFVTQGCTFTSADMGAQTERDIRADLEGELPVASGRFDTVLCLSVLEHVYNYSQLLREIRRVKKAQSTAIFWVPFFMQPHGTGHYGDYHRFTESALNRMFDDAGYSTCRIVRIGSIFWVLGNIVSQPLYSRKLLVVLAVISNLLWFVIGYALGRSQPTRWPIGFFVMAV